MQQNHTPWSAPCRAIHALLANVKQSLTAAAALVQEMWKRLTQMGTQCMPDAEHR